MRLVGDCSADSEASSIAPAADNFVLPDSYCAWNPFPICGDMSGPNCDKPTTAAYCSYTATFAFHQVANPTMKTTMAPSPANSFSI